MGANRRSLGCGDRRRVASARDDKRNNGNATAQLKLRPFKTACPRVMLDNLTKQGVLLCIVAAGGVVGGRLLRLVLADGSGISGRRALLRHDFDIRCLEAMGLRLPFRLL